MKIEEDGTGFAIDAWRNPLIVMKTKSTYSLLINSEEKSRSIFETAVYGLVVLSMAFSVFAFATQAVTVPQMQKTTDSPAIQTIATQPVDTVIAARG
jgi:hypothetical protein